LTAPKGIDIWRITWTTRQWWIWFPLYMWYSTTNINAWVEGSGSYCCLICDAFLSDVLNDRAHPIEGRLGCIESVATSSGQPPCYMFITCLLTNQVPDSWQAIWYVFPASLSPAGSNRRETEEFVYMQWVNLMQEIEGKA